MEKYSAFRDRGMPSLRFDRVSLLTKYPGSGIAPFFPIPTQPAGYALPLHVFLFVVRIFFLVPIALAYFLLLSWLPIGSFGKKAVLWCILGVPGIWWIDLGVDGVKKGCAYSYVVSHDKHSNVFPAPLARISKNFLIRVLSLLLRTRLQSTLSTWLPSLTLSLLVLFQRNEKFSASVSSRPCSKLCCHLFSRLPRMLS